MTDLYKVLGVARDATQEEIEVAYRREAQATHPDRQGGNNEVFQEVQRAGKVLRNQAARKRYDETGQDREETSLRRVAEQELVGLFLAAIDRANNLETIDLVGVVRGSINENIRKFTKNIEAGTSRSKHYKTAIARITRKGGAHNQVIYALEQKIDGIAKRVRAIERDIELGKLMLELLAEYEYKRENNIAHSQANTLVNSIDWSSSSTGGY